jgi:hypothetical protein
MLSCRLLGHRYRFAAEGAVMTWHCQRGCGQVGRRAYPDATLARRFAAAFDREDRADLGRRAPFFGLFPLRLWRWWRLRRREEADR